MFNLKRKPTHPGNILKEEFIEPLNITQTRLADELEISFKTVNEIVNEKRSISPEMALRLSRYFDTSVELWLNLQNQYDVYRVIKQKKTEINHIKPYGEAKAA